MAEEIIIDGVNVRKCEHFEEERCFYDSKCSVVIATEHDYCAIYGSCDKGKNCYYKQLQRLKQKCTYVKKKADRHKFYSPFAAMCSDTFKDEEENE